MIVGGEPGCERPSVTVQSFPPLVARDCRVLVLGSMPGVASLSAHEYYAHPQNAFWPIMASLCHFDRNIAYAQRCAALCKTGIAVWDVLAACDRDGSLDSAIDRGSEQPNDIPALLRRQPSIRVLWMNGQNAASMLRRHHRALSGAMVVLPSTSPANAGHSKAIKHAAWTQAFRDAELRVQDLSKRPNPGLL